MGIERLLIRIPGRRGMIVSRQIEIGPADQFATRFPQQAFGGPVDQQVDAALILHRYRHRDRIQHQPGEFLGLSRRGLRFSQFTFEFLETIDIRAEPDQELLAGG